MLPFEQLLGRCPSLTDLRVELFDYDTLVQPNYEPCLTFLDSLNILHRVRIVIRTQISMGLIEALNSSRNVLRSVEILSLRSPEAHTTPLLTVEDFRLMSIWPQLESVDLGISSEDAKLVRRSTSLMC